MHWSQWLWLTLAAAVCRRRLEETVAGWLHPPAAAIRCAAGRSGPAAVTLIVGLKTAWSSNTNQIGASTGGG